MSKIGISMVFGWLRERPPGGASVEFIWWRVGGGHKTGTSCWLFFPVFITAWIFIINILKYFSAGLDDLIGRNLHIAAFYSISTQSSLNPGWIKLIQFDLSELGLSGWWFSPANESISFGVSPFWDAAVTKRPASFICHQWRHQLAPESIESIEIDQDSRKFMIID